MMYGLSNSTISGDLLVILFTYCMPLRMRFSYSYAAVNVDFNYLEYIVWSLCDS